MGMQAEGIIFRLVFHIPAIKAFKGIKQIQFGIREGLVDKFGKFSAEYAAFRYGCFRALM